MRPSADVYFVPPVIRDGGLLARAAWRLGLPYRRCRLIARSRWLP